MNPEGKICSRILNESNLQMGSLNSGKEGGFVLNWSSKLQNLDALILFTPGNIG